MPGFLCFLNTPTLKARKGKAEIAFYNDGEYNLWKNTCSTEGWTIKYYKGLGTSTAEEFRDHFAQKKVVNFHHTGDASDDAVDMVFNKKRPEDRKHWLENYDRDAFLDTTSDVASYEDFINKELSHFSKKHCDRSIPNLMDGLKPSLRKILYAARRKGLKSEIKVAQLSGYVSEVSAYHHGEASLNAAIVGLAQNFVGSNNINLLSPNGQFGTRHQGGKDSASERYIFTQLEAITAHLFRVEDDAILDYVIDDGTVVEPRFYASTIPMICVNGSKGIGTGFSTDILCYNPLDIIAYLRAKLEGSHIGDRDFLPYYEGFTGTIARISDSKFLIKGLYETIGPDKIRVTELPVGYWTEDFKEHLEDLLDPTTKGQVIIKDYDDFSRDKTAEFVVTFHKGVLAELETIRLEHGCNGMEKALKLYTTSSTTNMYLFDSNDKLKKYERISEIIDDYFVCRLHLYEKRRQHMLEQLRETMVILHHKKRYIESILSGEIDLRFRNKDEIKERLTALQYPLVDDDFKYLTKLPMDAVSANNVARLQSEYSAQEAAILCLQTSSASEMWSNDIDSVEMSYNIYKESRQRVDDNEKVQDKNKDAKTKKKKSLKT